MKYYAPLIASLLFTCSAAQGAILINEQEENQSIPIAQRVDTSSGVTTIAAAAGAIPTPSSDPAITSDIDLYSFTANANDDINLDIDGGMGGLRSVETILTVFDSSGKVLRTSDYNSSGILDDGSADLRDPLIEHFIAPTGGTYYVGVSSWPNYLTDGGVVDQAYLAAIGAPDGSYGQVGDYALVITTPTQVVQTQPVDTIITAPQINAPQETAASIPQINIEIKPGSRNRARLNPAAKGQIPVALLSSSIFDPLNVDTSSLTFGSTGNESSLAKCQPDGKDANRDGRADLVCFFENDKAGFVAGDLEGTLRGKLNNGSSFEGRAILKVIPEKRSRLAHGNRFEKTNRSK
jgi:hypothetical protein